MPICAPRYTVGQVRDFPEDGQRYELLDGVLLVTPSPRPLHQIVTLRLAAQLQTLLEPGGEAHVVASGDVELGDTTLLIPDILVFPAGEELEASWQSISRWWLAVEVLSPSSRVYDRDFKRQAYLAIGVEEVWLVDPEAREIEIWMKGESAPRVEQEHIEWRGMGIDLTRVF